MLMLSHVPSDEKEVHLATRKRAPEAATRPGHIMYNVECNPSPSTCTSALSPSITILITMVIIIIVVIVNKNLCERINKHGKIATDL